MLSAIARDQIKPSAISAAHPGRVCTRRSQFAHGCFDCGCLASTLPKSVLGTVSIKFTPNGAEIFIDSVGHRHTPTTLHLPAGQYSVQLAMSGCKDWTSTLEVKEHSIINISTLLVRFRNSENAEVCCWSASGDHQSNVSKPLKQPTMVPGGMAEPENSERCLTR